MDAHLSNLLTHSIAWCSCKSITLTGNTTYGFLYQCSHISAYKHQVCESGGELNNLPVEIKSKICSQLQCSKILIFFSVLKNITCTEFKCYPLHFASSAVHPFHKASIHSHSGRHWGVHRPAKLYISPTCPGPHLHWGLFLVGQAQTTSAGSFWWGAAILFSESFLNRIASVTLNR